jgi:hypothetical protein
LKTKEEEDKKEEEVGISIFIFSKSTTSKSFSQIRHALHSPFFKLTHSYYDYSKKEKVEVHQVYKCKKNQ